MTGYDDIIVELDACVNRLAAENMELRALLAEISELQGALPERDELAHLIDVFKRIDVILDG